MPVSWHNSAGAVHDMSGLTTVVRNMTKVEERYVSVGMVIASDAGTSLAPASRTRSLIGGTVPEALEPLHLQDSRQTAASCRCILPAGSR